MTDPARILVTNDDGIEALGLRSVVEALADVGEVVVVAPDRNRSAVSRSITLGSMLHVDEIDIPGALRAYSTDGTPSDCVRLAALGLVGRQPDFVVSGANHGLNLGDDVTYSGTVAAAFEGLLMGIPAIAVSQQSLSRELGFRRDEEYDFTAMKLFVRGLVRHILAAGVPAQTVLSVNIPGLTPRSIKGVEICALGRRIYRDKLELQREDDDGRRHFTIYGDDPWHHTEEGTDISAISSDRIAVAPIHYDLTNRAARDVISAWPVDAFLGA